MKVKLNPSECCDNKTQAIHNLSLGTEYAVLSEDSEFYLIISDTGGYRWIFKKRFFITEQ